MGELDIYILGLALQHIESSYFDGAAGRKPPPILFTLLEGPNPSSFCTFCWKKKNSELTSFLALPSFCMRGDKVSLLDSA